MKILIFFMGFHFLYKCQGRQKLISHGFLCAFANGFQVQHLAGLTDDTLHAHVNSFQPQQLIDLTDHTPFLVFGRQLEVPY